MSSKKCVLITGSGGFIGKNLREQINADYTVFAPRSSELNLEDKQAVKTYLKDTMPYAVVHAANIGGNRKDGFEGIYKRNLNMFLNVADYPQYYEKMIQLGSGSQYNKKTMPPKVKEDYFGKSIPEDEYGLYKYMCSKYLQKHDKITELRIFGCYGKYEDYEIRFISNNICKALFGLPLTLSKQNVIFDYLYVGDLVRIIRHFIENPAKHKSYNATPSNPTDLFTIAKTINKVAEKDLPIKINKSGMGPEYSGDNSRLKEEIPNLKFTSLEDGIRSLYTYYEKNKNLIDKSKLIKDRY